MLPLATDSPLWLSVVLAVIALVAAGGTIVAALLGFETAKQQRETSKQEAYWNRNHAADQAAAARRHASEEAARDRQATIDAERVARLAVQRQTVFTRAMEDLFEWGDHCAAVGAEPRRFIGDDPVGIRLQDRRAVNLAGLRLLGSPRVATSYSKAWRAFAMSSSRSMSEQRRAAHDENGLRYRADFVRYAQADLGIESLEEDDGFPVRD